ncbi:prepilin-type N-terminal cleavage/methylation domain-containing protein [Ponticaulis koreensis]|uniref:prepilin-type N-terminal cleavage/methylation domain-containing protein n=1 Tax=Ponticaulis koreensis TaxID=1123045 RepID=UPI0003B3276D
MNDLGFTLVETLVALLILGLTFTYLGSMVQMQLLVLDRLERSKEVISELNDLPVSRPRLSELDANCVFDAASRQCRPS